MGKYFLLALLLTGCTGKICLVFDGVTPIYVKSDHFDLEKMQRGASIWGEAGYEFKVLDVGQKPTYNSIIVEDLPYDRDKLWGSTLNLSIYLNPEMPEEYLPTVFAHELGHSLGLHHVDEKVWPGCHLMSAGGCETERHLGEVEFLMLQEVSECHDGKSPPYPKLLTGLYHE